MPGMKEKWEVQQGHSSESQRGPLNLRHGFVLVDCSPKCTDLWDGAAAWRVGRKKKGV